MVLEAIPLPYSLLPLELHQLQLLHPHPQLVHLVLQEPQATWEPPRPQASPAFSPAVLVSSHFRFPSVYSRYSSLPFLKLKQITVFFKFFI